MPASRPSRRDFLRGSAAVAAGAVALPALLTPRELAALPMGSREWIAGLDAAARARNAGGPVILARNENPYGMNPKAKVAFGEAWEYHNRYNSPQAGVLKKRFAELNGVPEDHVLLTQGSREVLAMAVAAYGANGKEVITPWPSYEEVGRYGDVMGLTVHRVPQTDALEMDLNAMTAKIGPRTGLVFLCNPQNPTGT
ncbi:MAG: aminotransferase class I/II-fold pyridoxal phosphate-dependent enzyme, partial [Gemmatimonadetes bacterium]|nr:aminotransferase class I/II-fold pyridoxal phosphate-dependent enzyme [Gemmatimonadota bacterium]